MKKPSEIIKDKLLQNGGRAIVHSLTGKAYEIRSGNDGHSFLCDQLPIKPPYTYDVFDVIVGGKDVENGKPAPDIFLLAAQKLGVNPEDCFVIEDSENGIRAGAAAGMKCIGIPDIVSFSEEVKALMAAQFSSLDEAIGLFEKLQ